MVVEKGAQSLLDRDHPGKILLRNDSWVPNGCLTRNVLVFRGFLPSPPFLGAFEVRSISTGNTVPCFQADRVFSGLGYFFHFIPPLDKCCSVNRPVDTVAPSSHLSARLVQKKTIEESTAEGRGHESIIRVPVACRSCTIGRMRRQTRSSESTFASHGDAEQRSGRRLRAESES